MAAYLSFQLQHAEYKDQRAAFRSLIAQACRAALAHEGVGRIKLSVLLTNDEAVRALNYDFRGKNKPTNVLAFPSGEENYLGDIAISLDTVFQEAEEQGKSMDDHLTHLCVHACLHLLGYDHEKPAEAKIMEAKEIDILQLLDINNPYE